MRRLRFVLAVLIALAAGRGQAQVEGMLTGRLEWAGEVEVAADVWVAPGAELVVRPGTRVRFAEAPSTKTDPLFWQPGTELAVGGVLRVEGTPGAPVVFEGPAWGGLVAAPGSAVTLRHGVVRGAEEGFLVVGALAEVEGVRIEGGATGVVAGPGGRLTGRDLEVQGSEVGILRAGGELAVEGLVVDAADAGTLEVPEAAPDAVPLEPRAVAGPRVELLGEYTVDRDETWSGEVVVSGRVTVVPEAVLTLAPGTRVRFRRIDTNGDGLGEGELLVLGGIRSLGTLSAPVVFESAEAEPRPGDWDKVSLIASEDPGNRFAYTVFRHGVQALHAHFSAMTVEDCLFAENVRAVQFQESPSTVIRRSVFWKNKQALRFRDSQVAVAGVWLGRNLYGVHAFRAKLAFTEGELTAHPLGSFLAKESRVTLERVRFSAGRDGARFKDPGGVVEIRACTVRDVAQDALSFQEVEARVEGCELDGAGLDLVGADNAEVVLRHNLLGFSGRHAIHVSGPARVDARWNRWGGDPAERIHDGTDEPGLGTVLWEPKEEP